MIEDERIGLAASFASSRGIGDAHTAAVIEILRSYGVEPAATVEIVAHLHHVGSKRDLGQVQILFGDEVARIVDCLTEGAGFFYPAARGVRLMRSPTARAVEIACILAKAEDLGRVLDLDGRLAVMRAGWGAFEESLCVRGEHVALWAAARAVLGRR